MQQPPIDQSEIDARIKDHVEELLHLWWAEQGGATKDRDLQIVSSSIPFPRDRALRTVDLCCGPGDVGRAIRQNYPNAQIDFIDRDPLLLSICRGFNGRSGMSGTYRQLDLNDESWCQGLRARHYDVIATANAIHWLNAIRAKAVPIALTERPLPLSAWTAPAIATWSMASVIGCRCRSGTVTSPASIRNGATRSASRRL